MTVNTYLLYLLVSVPLTIWVANRSRSVRRWMTAVMSRGRGSGPRGDFSRPR